jgi:hypothetical protein
MAFEENLFERRTRNTTTIVAATTAARTAVCVSSICTLGKVGRISNSTQII